MSELHTVERLEDLPTPVPDATFVVIDVIICSTAIIRLLEAGAESVSPFAETASARAFKRRTPDALVVGEENNGATSEPFDLPPAPSTIRSADVDGRPVGIRTSNGTRAIDRIGLDKRVLVGSTINAVAVGERLHDCDGEVWLVAAGRNGSPVGEDILALDRISGEYTGRRSGRNPSQSRAVLDSSPSTAWLRENDSETAVEALLDFDASDIVPKLHQGVFVTE